MLDASVKLGEGIEIYKVIEVKKDSGTERIVIRKPKSIDECKMLVDIQLKIWEGDIYGIVSHYILHIANENGGLTLGAFKESGEAIGVLYGFLGYYHGRLIHYSHIAGVIPEYKLKGIGYHLKLAQREYVIKQGLDLIMWTFDPLQSINARFNIRKLGALTNTYHVNYYGEMQSSLNVGLESDRFKVEWWIKSPRVLRRLSGNFNPRLEDYLKYDYGFAIETDVNRCGVRKPVKINLDLESKYVIVEIPYDINEIKLRDIELARRWRYVTREVFTNYFKRGYYIYDYVVESNRGFYVLLKETLENILRGEYV